MLREKWRDFIFLNHRRKKHIDPRWFGGAAADVYWGPESLCQILGALPPASLASASFVAVELRGQTLQQGQGHGVPVWVPGAPTLGSWWRVAGTEEPVLC